MRRAALALTWPRAPLVLLVSLLLAGLVDTSSSPAGAQTFSFSASASAETSQMLISGAGLPVASSFDVGMPAAQAVLDSGGQSRAYAAAPYPSETIVTMPGLLASVGFPPLPPYPLIVQTEAPITPDNEINHGPLLLRAHSDSTSSMGLAQISTVPDASAAAATATVQAGADASPVVATGDSLFEGMSLADGLLDIGRVHSVAKASVNPDGAVSVTSSLEVTGASIAGVEVALGAEGLEIAGNRPVPVSLSQLNVLLAASNIKVDYLEPVVDSDGLGITAGGLQVTYVVTGDRPLTVAQTVGRARARINTATADGAPPAATPTPAPPTAPVMPSTPATPATPTPRSTNAVSLPPPPLIAPTSSAVALPPPASELSGQAPTKAPGIPQFELLALYFALIFAAGLLGGGGRLFRYLGVQRT